MPRKTLGDYLKDHAEYNAVNWRDHEAKALVIASDPVLLKRRLFDGRECLLYGYRELFRGARFDFAGKRLITRDGEYALQWLTRERPDLPDSYDNQQTSIGSCVLIGYGKKWLVGHAVQVIDRASGEPSYGEIERVGEITVSIPELGEFAPAVRAGNTQPRKGGSWQCADLAIRLTGGALFEIAVAAGGTTPDGGYTVCPL